MSTVSDLHPDATTADTASAVGSRAVVDGAFGLLASLHRLGSARVSELQRESGLPRTTVHRLLAQLEEVGAVERSGRRWRLGQTVMQLGAQVPGEPLLRSVARRPLLDLVSATGAHAVLSVEMAGSGVVVDVMPGTRTLAVELEPGMVLAASRNAQEREHECAAVRAHAQARRGDPRPVIDAGAVDRRVSCVAAPLRLASGGTAVVSLMMPGGGGVPASLVQATRHAARRIAARLSTPAAAAA